LKGTVYRSTGSWYSVKSENGEFLDCRLKGKFKNEGLNLTNPIAVGDKVDFESEENLNTGIITSIHPRENYIIRPSPRNNRLDHIIAANLDLSVLIISLPAPKTPFGFIDRFLLICEMYKIPSLLVFNKVDLYTEKQDKLFEEYSNIYASVGYRCHKTSAIEGVGLDDLKSYLKGNISIFSGQSGVGKSSLINALYPQLELEVQEISKYNNKGKHTTTFATMFDTEDGQLIDTPGIKLLGINNLEPSEISAYFVEFSDKIASCKFQDCKHINEPKCAIKESVKNAEISERRYKSYLSVLEEIDSVNYWDRR